MIRLALAVIAAALAAIAAYLLGYEYGYDDAAMISSAGRPA